MSRIILTNKNNEVLNPSNDELVLYKGSPILLTTINNNDDVDELSLLRIRDLLIYDYSIRFLKTTIDIEKYNVYAVDSNLCSVIDCRYLNDIIKSIQQGKPTAFKALNQDMCAVCGNGMRYELNKEYNIPKDELDICYTGFHFSLDFEDAVWNYDDFNNIRIFKVIIPIGSILEFADTKCCSNKIILSEEINPEQYIMNDIEMLRRFTSSCLKYSNDFLEYLIDKDLEIAYKCINNQLAEYGYDDDELVDKLMSKVRESDKFDSYNKDQLKYYSVKRSLELIKERNIVDLNLMNGRTIKALPRSYFKDNEDRLMNIGKLYYILTPEICLEHFDKPLIQRYIREEYISFDIFDLLIKEKSSWFENNQDILLKYYTCFISYHYNEDEFKRIFHNINIPKIFHIKLTSYCGVCDFELFKLCFTKAKLNLKDYENITIRTGEQLKFIIKKCGNNATIIYRILLKFNSNNFLMELSLNETFSSTLKRHYFNYFSKKINKMSKRKEKKDNQATTIPSFK